jgi:hypothetical protein
MGLTVLLPLGRTVCCGFLSPLKIHRPRPDSNRRILGPTSTLTTKPPSTTEKLIVDLVINTFPPIMERKNSFPYSKQFATGLYSEQNESSLQPQPLRYILTLSSHLCLSIKWYFPCNLLSKNSECIFISPTRVVVLYHTFLLILIQQFQHSKF